MATAAQSVESLHTGLANRGDALGRSMPHVEEAEQAVIGSILLDNLTFTHVIEVLGADDFYREPHQVLFDAIQGLYQTNSPIDLLTLTQELKRRGKLDAVGGPAYLQQCADSVPTAAHAAHYARMVREKSILRRTIQIATEIVQKAYSEGGHAGDDEGNEVDNLLDWAEHEIFSIAEKRISQTVVPMTEVIKASFKRIDELAGRKGEVTGVATGFDDLDRMTAGLQPSDLIILAARPSVGKTALALNIARNAAVLKNIPTLIFSLEMSKEALAMRMFSAEARIDGGKLRSGFLEKSDWPKLTQAASILQDAPLFIDDSASPSVLEIKAKARRLKVEHGLGLILIDYLQLIRPRAARDRNREQEIAEISRSLKALAKEMQVPVMALAQLNRAPEARTDPRPRLSDLRESGSIEQDADVILFLYREDMYKKEGERKADEFDPAAGPPPAELIIGKQRNGPTGTIFFTFLKEYTRFESFSYRSEAPSASGRDLASGGPPGPPPTVRGAAMGAPAQGAVPPPAGPPPGNDAPVDDAPIDEGEPPF